MTTFRRLTGHVANCTFRFVFVVVVELAGTGRRGVIVVRRRVAFRHGERDVIAASGGSDDVRV